MAQVAEQAHATTDGFFWTDFLVQTAVQGASAGGPEKQNQFSRICWSFYNENVKVIFTKKRLF